MSWPRVLVKTALIGVGACALGRVSWATGWLQGGLLAAGIVLVLVGLKVWR